MIEPVFYMRGNFPFTFERVISSELIDDAKQVLSVEFDVLNAIVSDLEAFPGFLDRTKIKRILEDYLKDEPQAEAISRLVFHLDAKLRSSNQTVEDLLGAIRDWQKSKENADGSHLTTTELDGLNERLPLILKRYPGLVRQAKAKHLSGAIGNTLESIEIICDMRPVFDDERGVLDGVIPLTTLKIVCIGIDGLPISLEAVLSERAVESLTKKATAATEKLKQLRELLKEKSLPIPLLEITKSED